MKRELPRSRCSFQRLCHGSPALHPAHGWSPPLAPSAPRRLAPPWAFSEEAAAEKYMPQLLAQYVGDCFAKLSVVDNHRSREMGRDPDLCRSAVSAPPFDSRAQI